MVYFFNLAAIKSGLKEFDAPTCLCLSIISFQFAIMRCDYRKTPAREPKGKYRTLKCYRLIRQAWPHTADACLYWLLWEKMVCFQKEKEYHSCPALTGYYSRAPMIGIIYPLPIPEPVTSAMEKRSIYKHLMAHISIKHQSFPYFGTIIFVAK